MHGSNRVGFGKASWVLRTLRRSAIALLALGLMAPALAGQIGLAWDASPDGTVTGYNVYYGTSSRTYPSKINVGNVTSYTVPNLTNGQTYYFAVTAYNAAAAESGYSNEAVATVPASPPSTTGLASSANPSNAGASVTFTATVTGTNPTGAVNFKDGTTSITGCSAVALSGSGNIRTAACTTSALAAGTRSITASYAGDAANAASTSPALAQVVKANSTTTLASSLNPAAAGASVTFTATVTGSNPTGTVNFKDGANSIPGCAAAALTGSGNTRTATCATSGLAAGTRTISAAYAGDTVNNASTSANLSQVVNSIASTTTSIASSLNPALVGASVTFTATVTGNAPTGSVNFKDGATSISGCSAIALAGTGNTRTAACTTSSLAAGAHTITAVYAGDTANATSTSAGLAQAINNPGSSTTTLASSANPSLVGSSVTFTATVAGNAPTGTVNFKVGTTSIAGCAAVALTGTGNARTAACSTSALTMGTRSISAAYSGDGANTGSTSATLSQVVQAASATTLTSSANPAAAGASVTFTATVTGNSPTGSVQFKDGDSPISGCAAVTVSGTGATRTAICTTSGLTSGTHSITATYAGDTNDAPSSSATLAQVVNPPPAAPTFADVPADFWAFSSIEAIAYSKVSLGCASNPKRFCPEGIVSRAEMAVFIERATRGIDFVYEPTGMRFADVPMTNWAVGPIEQLYLDGVTAGCASNPLRFCPTANVTRAEMAVFLLRAKLGPTYTPPAATGTTFADVPSSYWAGAWIEQFYKQGYTSGCGSNPLKYCPDTLVTRAEMAVFLKRVFNLAGPPP